MLSDFLTPPQFQETYKAYQIGACIVRHENDLPDLDNVKLAIFGLREGRGSEGNTETERAVEELRREFYRLSANKLLDGQLADLGDIYAGATFKDTERAVREVLKELRSLGIVGILMGGSKAINYAVYQSYEGVSNNIDMTYVAADLPVMPGQVLSQICEHQPNYLFNINALGFQSHGVPSQCLDIMEKLGFNQMRLGQLKGSPEEAEPWIRNTNYFAIDVGAIKHSDAPANYNANPSGIEGDLACKLTYYAGVSDLTSLMGIFELNPEYDFRNQTAKLGAQMMWYFMDGFANRVNDHPEQHKDFLRYRCNLDERQPDVIFHKSKRTSRWWMEVPNPKSLNNSEMNVIVPCSYADYQQAARGELTERFLKTIQKMH